MAYKKTCVYHPWGELVCYGQDVLYYGESWRRKPDEFVERFSEAADVVGVVGNDVSQVTKFIDDPANKGERYVILFEQEKRGTAVIPAYGEWVVLYAPRDLKTLEGLYVSDIKDPNVRMYDSWAQRARYMYVNNCSVKTYWEDNLENLNGTYGAGAHDVAKPFKSLRLAK